jgi:exopolysaccharide biosynthesis polyprenyl glycosylphosphotransferase
MILTTRPTVVGTGNGASGVRRGRRRMTASHVRRVDVALFATDAAVLAFAGRDASWLSTFLFGLVAIGTITSLGGYRHRLSLNTAKELPRLVMAVATAAALVGAVAPDADDVPRLLATVLPAIIVMSATRVVLGMVLRARRSSGRGTHSTIVVGAGLVGQRVLRHLGEHPEYGLSPVGFVDDADGCDSPFPVLGTVRELPTIIERFGITKVIVAFGVTRESNIVNAIRACDDQDIEFWTVPRFFEMGLSGGGYDDEVWGLPLTRLRRPALRTAQWRLKRVFDAVVAAVALIILSPAFLGITAAVKLTTHGPVFFRQRRIGQRGVPFDLLKFRTMQVNDDDGTTWTVTTDDRVTSVGRILRPASLDELPQLLNVLRGDMSLVGPRPERPYFVEAFSKQIPRYDDRHRVPVGMTGLAQVNGLRGDTSIEERSVFDNFYIENWSLWSDIAILVRTVAAVVRPPASVRVEAVSRHVGTGPAEVRDFG